MAQINKPDEYFNTKLYTGNSSTNNITGVGFQPDWVWLKDRDSIEWHNVFDIVRGITANRLYPNSTTATDGYDPNALQSFDSDGFTLGSGAAYNNSGNNFVSWNWLASNTTASNTDGSITSTVSANTTSGFSIVSYTGTGANATVGHGLSSVPKMIIVKDRSANNNWTVYHVGVGNDKDILLDVTNAENTSTAWNNTTPTSSVFSIGTLGNVNTSSNNYIAYCFADKKGYSKFGSYTGNGSTDGTFIYTGFKPAFVMCKRTDSTGVWFMCDNKRVGFNGRPNNTATVGNPELSANDPRSEAAGNTNVMDIFSNGFKLIQSGAEINGSGASFIYMAFASEPLVGTNNIPATAR